MEKKYEIVKQLSYDAALMYTKQIHLEEITPIEVVKQLVKYYQMNIRYLAKKQFDDQKDIESVLIINSEMLQIFAYDASKIYATKKITPETTSGTISEDLINSYIENMNYLFKEDSKDNSIMIQEFLRNVAYDATIIYAEKSLDSDLTSLELVDKLNDDYKENIKSALKLSKNSSN